jgi:hypothetical protein
MPWLDDGAPPVAAPSFRPCPDGWRETELAGVPICDPIPKAEWRWSCNPRRDRHVCTDRWYDLSRLDDGVAFNNNRVNLDATALPVPQPVEAVAAPE